MLILKLMLICCHLDKVDVSTQDRDITYNYYHTQGKIRKIMDS